MFRLGFTGTRHGMSPRQRVEVLRRLVEIGPGELHHGACHLGGADAEVHVIALELGWRIVLHPSTLGPLLPCYASADEMREPLPPLQRNRAIIAACEFLIAAPRTAEEQPRSGTDTTVRYARRAGRRGVRIRP